MVKRTNKRTKKEKKKKFEAQEWPSSRHAKVSWVIFAEVPFYGAQPSVATSLGTLSCRAYDRFHWLSTLRLRLACRFNGVAPWKKKVGARHRFSARFSTWSRDTTGPPFSIARIIEQTRFPTDEVEKYERIHWLCFQQTKEMLFLKQNSLEKLT